MDFSTVDLQEAAAKPLTEEELAEREAGYVEYMAGLAKCEGLGHPREYYDGAGGLVCFCDIEQK